jgi:hypothetical protein
MKAEHRIGWHVKGGWCRKFPGDRNRTYFGRVPAAEAVRLMHREETRRERGEAKADQPANLTIRQAVNLFLARADREHAAGRMSDEQRASYGQELAILAASIGRRPLADLCRMDAPEQIFRPIREAAVARGLAAAEKHVVQVRTFLDWCSRVRRFVAPPFFADAFDAPGEKEKRKARKAERRAKGEATWTAAEVRQIADAARQTDVHRYAHVLLMINGAMGAADLSELDDADVDWQRGCIHTDRSKTLVPRVVPLWAATAAAMRASRAARPAPADPADATRFFLTMHGRPLVTKGLSDDRKRVTRTDAVRNWFTTLLNAADRARRKGKAPRLRGLKRHRAGAYTLRSVWTTAAVGQDKTLLAVIRGDTLPGGGALEYYLRGDLLNKLRAVTEHVRLQLWPDGGPPLPPESSSTQTPRTARPPPGRTPGRPPPRP